MHVQAHSQQKCYHSQTSVSFFRCRRTHCSLTPRCTRQPPLAPRRTPHVAHARALDMSRRRASTTTGSGSGSSCWFAVASGHEALQKGKIMSLNKFGKGRFLLPAEVFRGSDEAAGLGSKHGERRQCNWPEQIIMRRVAGPPVHRHIALLLIIENHVVHKVETPQGVGILTVFHSNLGR